MKFYFFCLLIFLINLTEIKSQPTVSLNNVISQPSTNVAVQLRLKSFSNVGAISLKISANPTIVNFIGLSSNYNNLSISSSFQNGVLTIGWFDFTGTNPLNIADNVFTVLNFSFNGGYTNLNFLTNQCEISDINGQPIQNIVYVNGSISQTIQLSPPILYFPANNSQTLSTVEFKWSKVDFAQEYNLVVSNNANFVGTVLDQWIISDTSYTFQLMPNIQYFWKVRAKTSSFISGFSSTFNFTTSLTSVEVSDLTSPEIFELQVYPNPFNPSTRVRFDLNQPATPVISILNSIGELIISETLDNLSTGTHDLILDTKNLPSGIYLIMISIHNNFKVKKAIKLN